MSDDGQLVIGNGYQGDDRMMFVWTPSDGLAPLVDDIDSNVGLITGYGTISADGKVILGRVLRQDGREAFYWTESTGIVLLGDLPGGELGSRVWGASRDGSILAGTGQAGDGTFAMRWTEATGLQSLGDLPGGDAFSFAYSISRDGAVIVGSGTTQQGPEPTRWTAEGGMVGLGALPGGSSHGEAFDVSGDGGVIIGSSGSGRADREAFRWTAAEGMKDLGAYPFEIGWSDAIAVSADGNIIVGQMADQQRERFVAFLWTRELGVQPLQEVLVDGGAEGLAGWQLQRVSDISGDGQWIVGYGENPQGVPEAYRARLSSNLVHSFSITPALNDAWFNEDTPGQGFFISVLPESLGGLIFLAWFTYDTERPPEGTQFNLEGAGHRWRTAFGPYEGDRAVLDIEVTTGGIFDSALPEPGQVLDGTIELVFQGCNSATLSYEIPSISRSGSMNITRIVPDNVAACEAAE